MLFLLNPRDFSDPMNMQCMRIRSSVSLLCNVVINVVLQGNVIVF